MKLRALAAVSILAISLVSSVAVANAATQSAGVTYKKPITSGPVMTITPKPRTY